ncbi:hypothetical protein [Breoghania sp. L-A4]|uniref:hypothetical protein n=1 Tax=Breoghania sp. L-A4 TaxID=2304600 RepID=UPI0019689224|nr:hypothetical protein [Breoghania sp. L-A4]
MAANKLTRADQNMAPPHDAAGFFLNRLNKVYRVTGAKPDGSYQGQIGFIYE